VFVPFWLSLIWLTRRTASAQGTSLAFLPPVSTLFQVFLSVLARLRRSRLRLQRAPAGPAAGVRLMATDPKPRTMSRMQATRTIAGGRAAVWGALSSVIGENVLVRRPPARFWLTPLQRTL